MQSNGQRKPFSLVNIIGFLLGVGVLAALLTQINLSELLASLLQVDAVMFALGGLAYLCKAFIRALRFWRFERASGHAVPFWRMARLSFASTLASQILPLKLGELTYVYLVRTDLGSTVARGLSGLMIIRVFDLLAIGALFLGIAGVIGLPGTLSVYFTAILVLSLLLTLALVGLMLAGRLKVRAPGSLTRIPFLQKPLALLRHTLDDLNTNARHAPEMAALALVEWLANFIMYHLLLIGLGLTPQFLHSVVAVTLAALISLLPVNSFGNFGTQEAGWATGLVLLGYTQNAALTSGFATHLLVMVYVSALGVLAWLSYLFTRKIR